MEAFPMGVAGKPGDSFLQEFESRISRFAGFITTHPGDITKIGWSGVPIEFLLVDANKSWQLSEYIGKVFYPHLIVGKSLIFEQDFKHYFTPWLHILHYRLRDFLSPYLDLAGTCSVVFQAVKSIDPTIVPSAEEMKAISSEELDEVYEYSMAVISDRKGWEASNIMASKVMFYLHENRQAEARTVLDAVLAQGFTMDSDLAVCCRFLEDFAVRPLQGEHLAAYLAGRI